LYLTEFYSQIEIVDFTEDFLYRVGLKKQTLSRHISVDTCVCVCVCNVNEHLAIIDALIEHRYREGLRHYRDGSLSRIFKLESDDWTIILTSM
jgi:hypothetical protein